LPARRVHRDHDLADEGRGASASSSGTRDVGAPPDAAPRRVQASDLDVVHDEDLDPAPRPPARAAEGSALPARRQRGS